jgi:hypothetical protein
MLHIPRARGPRLARYASGVTSALKRTQAASLAIAILVLAAPGSAAAGHVCDAIEPGVISVDAMLDDWRGLAPLGRGNRSADASFDLRCAYDEAQLYLSVRVRDDRIIRAARRSGALDDSLQLSLRGGSGPAAWTLSFHPGTRGFPARREGGEGARADDSLTDDGWQVELGVPLARVPGWGKSTPLLFADLELSDADRAGAVDARLRFTGSLDFSTHVPALRGFLSTAGTRALRLDVLAEMDGVPGTERVVVAGRMLGVLTDSFAFIELPLSTQTDLRKVEVIDFDGDGRSSLLTHHRQHGGGGSREVLTVWSVAASGELERALAVEVMLELGGRRLANRWSLVPAGARRTKGTPSGTKRRTKGTPSGTKRRAGRRAKRARGAQDILIEVSLEDSAGWDAASFARITPSPDVRPILTPWTGKRAAVYYFDGEVALEAPARPAR